MPSSILSARPCRILVVDDNPDAVRTMAMLMEMNGHEVRTASDGIEALEVAATFQPEAALLDIGLPRMNGYELAQRLRQEPWGKGIILIALTGWGQDDDRALEAGFDHHLTKPVTSAVIEKLLAQPAPAVKP
jgi:CheY-like chemotaxis protein